MSKSLRSYPEYKRSTVVSRRLKAETKGLGYWGAYDFLHGKRPRVQPSQSPEAEPTPVLEASDVPNS